VAPLAQPQHDLPGDAWKDRVEAWVETHRQDVLGLLLAVNEGFGYLPRNVLAHVSAVSSIPLARLVGIASFYRTFRLEPRGRHTVRVCQGTACHVAGAHALVHAMRRRLGVELGRTAVDGSVTLESVACVGCCSLAPVVQVDGDTRGHQSSSEALRWLEGLEAG
jgi:NADH-quinone oxidoreductase subunit E